MRSKGTTIEERTIEERMADEITEAARSYKAAVEASAYRAIARVVHKQSAVLLLKMNAIRGRYGDEAVDGAMKSFDADVDTWVTIETPSGMPWSVAEIEKREKSSSKVPIGRPKARRSPLDTMNLAVEDMSMER